MTWTSDELARLHCAQELRVAGRREDGTLRRLVIIWAVVVDGDLYLRSVRGADGAWYRGVQQTHESRIESGGVAADVGFVDVPSDDPVQAAIDAAYAEKYPSYPSAVDSITTAEATATTMRAVHADGFVAEAHRQSRAVAVSPSAADDQAFVDSISVAWDE